MGRSGFSISSVPFSLAGFGSLVSLFEEGSKGESDVNFSRVDVLFCVAADECFLFRFLDTCSIPSILMVGGWWWVVGVCCERFPEFDEKLQFIVDYLIAS